jgi:hypothetical protein
MAKRTAQEAELDMHAARRSWIKSQRRQGILLGTKKECKATVLAKAKAQDEPSTEQTAAGPAVQ